MEENACSLRKIGHAEEICKRIVDYEETANFKDRPPEDVESLLHMVTVGGSPAGLESAAELPDF